VSEDVLPQFYATLGRIVAWSALERSVDLALFMKKQFRPNGGALSRRALRK
jgi:hypothetical protein